MAIGLKIRNQDGSNRLILDEASKVLVQKPEGVTVLNNTNTTVQASDLLPDAKDWTVVQEGGFVQPSTWKISEIRRWSSTTDTRFDGTCFITADDDVNFFPTMLTAYPPLYSTKELIIGMPPNKSVSVRSLVPQHTGTTKGKYLNIYNADRTSINWSDEALIKSASIIAVSNDNFGTFDLSFIPPALRSRLYVRSTLGAWAKGSNYIVSWAAEGVMFKFTDGKSKLHWNKFSMYADPEFEGFGAIRQNKIMNNVIMVALLP